MVDDEGSRFFRVRPMAGPVAFLAHAGTPPRRSQLVAAPSQPPAENKPAGNSEPTSHGQRRRKFLVMPALMSPMARSGLLSPIKKNGLVDQPRESNLRRRPERTFPYTTGVFTSRFATPREIDGDGSVVVSWVSQRCGQQTHARFERPLRANEKRTLAEPVYRLNRMSVTFTHARKGPTPVTIRPGYLAPTVDAAKHVAEMRERFGVPIFATRIARKRNYRISFVQVEGRGI